MVEMLTAVAVLMIIVVLMVGLAGQAGAIWSQGESQNQHRQRARAVLDFMSEELRRAVHPVNPSALSPQFVINPSGSPEIGPQFCNPDAAFWQAPVTADDSAGDLAEVGYFIRWDGNQPNLCRFFVNPSDANYLIYSSPESWVSDNLLNSIAPADQANQYQGLFLENVVGLWVKAYRADGSVYPGNSRAAGGTLPAMVKLSLVLVDASTSKLIDAPDALRKLCAESSTPGAFMAHASLPPKLRKGLSVVENVVALSAAP